MSRLTTLIRGNKAKFLRYRGGCLVYGVFETTPVFMGNSTDKVVLEFEIPIEELQGATVNAVEPASYFMKWIRKAVKQIAEGEESE